MQNLLVRSSLISHHNLNFKGTYPVGPQLGINGGGVVIILGSLILLVPRKHRGNFQVLDLIVLIRGDGLHKNYHLRKLLLDSCLQMQSERLVFVLIMLGGRLMVLTINTMLDGDHHLSIFDLAELLEVVESIESFVLIFDIQPLENSEVRKLVAETHPLAEPILAIWSFHSNTESLLMVVWVIMVVQESSPFFNIVSFEVGPLLLVVGFSDNPEVLGVS
mmetsp:Transcript_22207/g.21434  ORF Transcript_22207/g.21434 Transcript_22207/m.21434 type:complete len:219 (-) Transcript_22207:46-702(-)